MRGRKKTSKEWVGGWLGRDVVETVVVMKKGGREGRSVGGREGCRAVLYRSAGGGGGGSVVDSKHN